MKKRLLALAVACMMLASTLASCGSGNADSSAGPESSSAQDTASDAVTTAAEQLLGWPLLWSRKGCLPEYMALVCGVLIR